MHLDCPNHLEDPSQQLLNQAALFGLLARGFAYPDSGQRSAMGESFARLLRAQGEHQDFQPLASLLMTTTRYWELAEARGLEEEYVRLFLGSAPCSPHETAYGDGRRMAGRAVELADISGYYAAFGLETSTLQPDLPDHLSAELEFYSLLLVKQAYALTEGWQPQFEISERAARSFLEHHLGRWIEAFVSGLAEQQAPLAYQALGALLQAAIQWELERLGIEPERLEGRLHSDPMQQDELICPHARPEADLPVGEAG